MEWPGERGEECLNLFVAIHDLTPDPDRRLTNRDSLPDRTPAGRNDLKFYLPMRTINPRRNRFFQLFFSGQDREAGMKMRTAVLLILVPAFVCAGIDAGTRAAAGRTISSHAGACPANAGAFPGLRESGTDAHGPLAFVAAPDEQLEQDKAEAIRRLDAIIDAIRSYANRRHTLSEEQDRAGAAELERELKAIEDFTREKNIDGYSEIKNKYGEAVLLNDQFNLSETLQDIGDLKKEIEAFNAVRSGYSFAQEEEGVRRFDDAMDRVERFAKDVCNKYDAEERVAAELRKARDLLHNYVSPAKADTLRALDEIDRRILAFNQVKHTYAESRRNASIQAFENEIKEKEAFAKSRRFDGDQDFKNKVKLVKEHLNDDRTPMSADMDALKAKYNAMSKPLSVADINIMQNEIGTFQSTYGNALNQGANRGIQNEFNSLIDKVRQAMVEQLGIEQSYRQIKNAFTAYENSYKSRSADACRKALDEIQTMIDNFKTVFRNTSTQNFVSWFTGDWINGDDYTAYKSDINLIENKLKDYRKELDTGKPAGPALQNIPTAAELDRELEAAKQLLERAADQVARGRNDEAERIAEDAAARLFRFKNDHMAKIEDDYKQMQQNPMRIPQLEQDPYFYGKLKEKYDDYKRMTDKVGALIAGETAMLEAIRNMMTMYERNVRWQQHPNERRGALGEIKRHIQAFEDAFNNSWDQDLALVLKLKFTKLQDVYDKYKDEINQINRKIETYWNETHQGGMTPREAFNLLKGEFARYESQVRNKKSKQEMLAALDNLHTLTENFKKIYENVLRLPEYSQMARELERMKQMIEDYRREARSSDQRPVLYNYTPQQQAMLDKLASDINQVYRDIDWYKSRKDSITKQEKDMFKNQMERTFDDLENRVKNGPFKDNKELKDSLKAAKDYWNRIK